ncbi:hypothetical protein EK21DRAFT_93699 [Setomelanomma holmii]|uniref:Transposase n=1 Tax=Setomelanomma holmii TaxID=210430 RepID=A0A9P4LFU8_9PLEO|nr:hypothetical protein EK21DRAFT_93699 [Setomelanomma holmii]
MVIKRYRGRGDIQIRKKKHLQSALSSCNRARPLLLPLRLLIYFLNTCGKRLTALIQGTHEYAHLARVNAEIDAHNKQLPRRQRKGRHQKMMPERLYCCEKYSRDLFIGGLDFVWYAFEVYDKLLFLYYRHLREKYPGYKILISEDSATPHIKARKLL